ncbi:hypothetical protein, partial [Francisella tularensis]|uniref:hypothetical protein n=1 Tax=Francisella tularensis TaxID=263 RepID=UPI001F3C006D
DVRLCVACGRTVKRMVECMRIWRRYEVIVWVMSVFFFQAEDGIRDPEMYRGLGDVYKRQV